MLIELADVSCASLTDAGIGEGLLHQALAVVEGPFDPNRLHVAADGGELRLLHRRDRAEGKQDDDARAGQSRKRLGHRAAGVAGGRDQDRERPIVGVECRHQPRHDAGADILEGKRRAVEELEDRDGAVQRHQRDRKIQRRRQSADRAPAAAGRRRRSGRRSRRRVRRGLRRSGRASRTRADASGTYSPPSGASPSKSAVRNDTGGELLRVLMNRIDCYAAVTPTPAGRRPVRPPRSRGRS